MKAFMIVSSKDRDCGRRLRLFTCKKIKEDS